MEGNETIIFYAMTVFFLIGAICFGIQRCRKGSRDFLLIVPSGICIVILGYLIGHILGVDNVEWHTAHRIVAADEKGWVVICSTFGALFGFVLFLILCEISRDRNMGKEAKKELEKDQLKNADARPGDFNETVSLDILKERLMDFSDSLLLLLDTVKKCELSKKGTDEKIKAICDSEKNE